RAMASPVFTNLGDDQAEAKEHMLSLYFSPEFYSLVQRDMLPGMQGNHMWLIAMATLHAGEWRHLSRNTSHSVVAAFARALRKDPEVTFHALDELLTYMAIRALLKVFLAESRDAHTAAATEEFSADNFVASLRDTMVAQTESFLGEPGVTPLSRNDVETRNSNAGLETACDRTAVFLAGQRDGALYTPSDGGRAGSSDAAVETSKAFRCCGNSTGLWDARLSSRRWRCPTN
ncbi:hypothetical protein SARC_08436, partial [Sphaeroforma arctica JP610]